MKHKRGATMKKYRSFVAGGVLFCAIVLLSGCSSSELVDIWSNSAFQSPPLNTLLVISVGKNLAHRRIWEDAFGSELAKHKVTATPSYRLFPDALPDTDQVVQIVRSKGFDGVLVIRWLPSEMIPQYSQGYGEYEQHVRYDLSSERFVTYYRNIYYAGYMDSQKVDVRAIDVWATKNEGQLIWSATSKTAEPNSISEVRPDIVDLVMSELTNRHFIASGR